MGYIYIYSLMMLCTNLWLRVGSFWRRMFFLLGHRLQEDSPHSRWMLALQKPQTQQGMIFQARAHSGTFKGCDYHWEHIPRGSYPCGTYQVSYSKCVPRVWHYSNWDNHWDIQLGSIVFFLWGIQNKYPLVI